MLFSVYFCNNSFDKSINNITHYINAMFVPYGCETWSLTLMEECRLRVLENRILRQIFGPKRDENGEWRRLHNEELHSLYRSPNIVMGRACSQNGGR